MKATLHKGDVPPAGCVFALSARSRAARFRHRPVSFHYAPSLTGVGPYNTSLCGTRIACTASGQYIEDGDRLCPNCKKRLEQGGA